MVAATVLMLFGLEVLALVFGRLGRRRIVVVSSPRREAIDRMFERLKTNDYTLISYEVETQRTPAGPVYRAALVLRAKSNAHAEAEGYITLLCDDPDISVERIV